MMTTKRADRAQVFEFSQQRLTSILDDIDVGRIRLPFFHRDWCWSSDHILNLLESISQGDPIGSVTFVRATPPGTRVFDGVDPSTVLEISPVHLVLDGQQRLTAAYQACCKNAPVKIISGARPERRLYFFDIKAALSSEHRLKDAIFSVATKADGTALHNRGINFTDPLIQYERGIFPTNAIFKFDAYESRYSQFWDNADNDVKRSEALKILREFRATVVTSFENYRLSVETSERPMADDVLCRIYQKLNSPGLSGISMLALSLISQIECLLKFVAVFQ